MAVGGGTWKGLEDKGTTLTASATLRGIDDSNGLENRETEVSSNEETTTYEDQN